MSGYLLSATLATREALLVTFCLLLALQTSYAALLCERRDFKPLSPSYLYELAVGVHLALMCSLCVSAALGETRASIDFGSMALPLEPLLWTNALPAAMAVMLAWRRREPRFLASALCFALCVPPLAAAFGPWWPAIAAADAGQVLARTIIRVGGLREEFLSSALRMSASEALDAMPEGILCVTESGRPVYMNDAMRGVLVALGMQTDLANLGGLWDELSALDVLSREGPEAAHASLPRHGIALTLPGGEVRYLTRSPMGLLRTPCSCIVALDVTERYRLREEGLRTGRELEAAGRELARSLGQVQELARREAELAVRARVHDVIGQRLSILHRCLEDGDLSDEALAKVSPLITGILDDLRSGGDGSPREQLEAVADAFGTVGLEVDVSGVLPEREDVAGLFVKTIREACTNAMRHGQAGRVRVAMDQGEGTFELVVDNDGTIPEDGRIREGGGLRGMRHRAERLGGTVSVEMGPRFTIRMKVPMSRPT